MDFLDPRKMRAHRHRLILGYILVAAAILLCGYILVYAASGFSYNRKTGQIVVNGLLFVDSKPGGAQISINDQAYSKTSARLILPASNYKLSLAKSGYLTWSRNFVLKDSATARFVYPFLFPAKPEAKTLKSYSAQPGMVSESLDHRWLLLQTQTSTDAATFEELDTTNLSAAPQELKLSSSVADLSTPDNSFKAVEWAADNKHVLLEHDFTGGSEFIIFDRDNPADSVNINKLFNVMPKKVQLKNKKSDQLYILQDDGNLVSADTSKTSTQTVLKNVLEFNSNGSSLILYVASDLTNGQANAKIFDGSKSYQFATITPGNKYLIDLSQYQGDYYYAVGSDVTDRVNIYKNPLNDIKNAALGKAQPLLALHNPGATELSFSANSRFVATEAGQSLSVYDFETQDYYRYSLSDKLDSSLEWMDGHRWIGDSNGTIFVSDYDGTNHHLLLPTVLGDGGFFDKDFNHLFTVAPATDNNFVLESIDMRAGADLPKSGQ